MLVKVLFFGYLFTQEFFHTAFTSMLLPAAV